MQFHGETTAATRASKAAVALTLRSALRSGGFTPRWRGKLAATSVRADPKGGAAISLRHRHGQERSATDPLAPAANRSPDQPAPGKSTAWHFWDLAQQKFTFEQATADKDRSCWRVRVNRSSGDRGAQPSRRVPSRLSWRPSRAIRITTNSCKSAPMLSSAPSIGFIDFWQAVFTPTTRRPAMRQSSYCRSRHSTSCPIPSAAPTTMRPTKRRRLRRPPSPPRLISWIGSTAN